MVLNEYRLLGRTGLRVSRLCLGTMTFGTVWGWGSAEETARQVYDHFLDSGGNFVDTAKGYTNGTSERLIGLHASLERLQTDYVDLYWLHNWDRVTTLEEGVSTLNDLVEQGKIRYFGFSNVPA
jgi:aryl-alcohol dehydrogenase-like predicted oxidoreductase